jgi:hypothetical protein
MKSCGKAHAYCNICKPERNETCRQRGVFKRYSELRKGKTYEDIFGEGKAKLIKEEKSKNMTGRVLNISKEERQRRSDWMTHVHAIAQDKINEASHRRKGITLIELYGKDKAIKLINERTLKIVKTRRKNNSYIFSDVHLQRMSDATTARYLQHNFKPMGYFYSKKNNVKLPYRSSYELAFLKEREHNPDVLTYRYETMYISYIKDTGKSGKSLPDVISYYTDGSRSLDEVKPQFKIDKNLDNTLAKLAAYKKYADEHGMKFNLWTEKELHL